MSPSKKNICLFATLLVLAPTFAACSLAGESASQDNLSRAEALSNGQKDPNDPKDPGNPDDPKDPGNPDDPKDPGNPDDPKDPNDPKDPGNPDDPKDPGNPKDPNDPKEPSKQAQGKRFGVAKK
jgi:hypothetical protein